MNKTELIDAIQHVIVPNGQKAITAESLANLLTEIVKAMGTGVVFHMGTPNEDFTEFTQTPEEMAHNAEMFNIIKQSDVALNATTDMTHVLEFDAGLPAISGNKLNSLVLLTQYVPLELAEIEGFWSDCIILQTLEYGDLMVLPDGSLSIMTDNS